MSAAAQPPPHQDFQRAHASAVIHSATKVQITALARLSDTVLREIANLLGDRRAFDILVAARRRVSGYLAFRKLYPDEGTVAGLGPAEGDIRARPTPPRHGR